MRHGLIALRSLSRIGIPGEDADIARALDWFITHQQSDGLWLTDYRKGRKTKDKEYPMRLWISLAICRICKRYEH